jgi:hypothetical protein
MRNRAKCKLCSSIIESMHATDLVLCKCEHIFVDGGDAFKCGAEDWSNFLRIDDNGKEIQVKIESHISNESETVLKPHKEELLEYLDEMIKSYEILPQHAMMAPITHYDHQSLLILLSAILRSD